MATAATGTTLWDTPVFPQHIISAGGIAKRAGDARAMPCALKMSDLQDVGDSHKSSSRAAFGCSHEEKTPLRTHAENQANSRNMNDALPREHYHGQSLAFSSRPGRADLQWAPGNGHHRQSRGQERHCAKQPTAEILDIEK